MCTLGLMWSLGHERNRTLCAVFIYQTHPYPHNTHSYVNFSPHNDYKTMKCFIKIYYFEEASKRFQRWWRWWLCEQFTIEYRHRCNCTHCSCSPTLDWSHHPAHCRYWISVAITSASVRTESERECVWHSYTYTLHNSHPFIVSFTFSSCDVKENGKMSTLEHTRGQYEIIFLSLFFHSFNPSCLPATFDVLCSSSLLFLFSIHAWIM